MTYSQGPTACSLEMAQSVLSSITRLATDIYRIPLSKPNIVLRTNNPRTAMLRNLRSMPGFVVELAYHDHVDDAKLLKSTDFLKAAARATTKELRNIMLHQRQLHHCPLHSWQLKIWAEETS